MLHKLLFADIQLKHYKFTYVTPHGFQGELFISKEEARMLGKPIEKILRLHHIIPEYHFDTLDRINDEILCMNNKHCIECENCGGLLW